MRLRDALKLLDKSWYSEYLETRRLKRLPRRQAARTKLFGCQVEVPDAASFLSMRGEILNRKIYDFKARKPDPRIVDGGANIGMGILFFKQRWPQSRITAFEPDPTIFAALEHNLKSAGLSDVQLVNKALWSSNSEISFIGDGADAGRVSTTAKERQNVVPTVRLRDYLEEETDLLKLDIEGAELEVLRDTIDRLHHVRNLFVECHSFIEGTQNLDQILNLLRESGFRYFVEPVCRSEQPFIARPVYGGMDLQVNVFASRDW